METLSRRISIEEYTNGFSEKRIILKDLSPVNDNCHEINMGDEELAALTRYLTKQVLEELLEQVRAQMTEGVVGGYNAGWNRGIKIVADFISSKLKGVEDASA